MQNADTTYQLPKSSKVATKMRRGIYGSIADAVCHEAEASGELLSVEELRARCAPLIAALQAARAA